LNNEGNHACNHFEHVFGLVAYLIFQKSGEFKPNFDKNRLLTALYYFQTAHSVIFAI